MNKLLLTTLMLLCLSLRLPAQTFAEFFRQNKTQKKYLLEQIAALRLYAGYVEKGYRIAGGGLNVIGLFSGREEEMHREFFRSLSLIAPFLDEYKRHTGILQAAFRLKNLAGQIPTEPENPQSAYFSLVKTALLNGCASETEHYLETLRAGTLEMTDNERLNRLEELERAINGQIAFARHFLLSIAQLKNHKNRELKTFSNSKRSMKYPIKILSFLFTGLMAACMTTSHAQSQEAQQLLLNVEKLSQLKNILRDMEKGYTILSKGYKAVSSIAEGNFSLHDLFLDGLMQVSPAVRKYYRLTEVLNSQKRTRLSRIAALRRYTNSGLFSASELQYFGRMFRNLDKKSLEQLDLLTMVITPSRLRMNDEERLEAIDQIAAATGEQEQFLKKFMANTDLLSLQRQKERAEIRSLKTLFTPVP